MTPNPISLRKSPKTHKPPRVSNTVKILNSIGSEQTPLKDNPESKKRPLSDSSPKLSENKRADTMNATDKSIQAMAKQIAELGSTLSGQLTSVNKELSGQLHGVRSDLDGLTHDLRDLDRKLDSRVSAIEDRQDASDKRVDGIEKKLETFQGKVESELDKVRQLIENGPISCLSRSNLSFDELHERQLQEQIHESKSMVTVINTGKLSLTTKEMAALLISEGFTTKSESKAILFVARMGGPKSPNPAYKVKLDSPSAAQELLEKSRADTRDSRDARLIKIFPYTPADYAIKHREFRVMQSLLMSEGYVARIEFEGTTMVLKTKKRSTAGLWCIVKGGSFRPLTTGREDPTEGEDPGVAKARDELAEIFTPPESSPLAHSLTLVTKESLGNIEAVKEKLGATSTAEMVSYMDLNQPDAGGRNKYRLFFSTRAAACAALESTQNNVTGDVKLSSTDFLKVTMPWVL